MTTTAVANEVVLQVREKKQEHVLIRNGNYFTTLPGPNTRPGYRTKVTVTVHNLAGRKLAEYQGESVPSESFHRMEAARSACRKAIGKMPSSTSIYW